MRIGGVWKFSRRNHMLQLGPLSSALWDAEVYEMLAQCLIETGAHDDAVVAATRCSQSQTRGACRLSCKAIDAVIERLSAILRA